MSKIGIFVKTIGKFIGKNSPTILTGMCIIGFGTAVVYSAKKAPEAKEKLDKAKEEKKEESGEDLTVIETAKVLAPIYWPVAALMVVSTACGISANTINIKRNAALASAWAIADTTLTEYRKEVVNEIGERKEEKVRQKVVEAKQQIVGDPVDDNIFYTNLGSTLCFDAMSGRYFMHDIDSIKRAINNLNFRMIDEMYISLNDLYYELGLPYITIGDDLGWNVDDGPINMTYTSGLTKNDKPYFGIDAFLKPRIDYRDLH